MMTTGRRAHIIEQRGLYWTLSRRVALNALVSHYTRGDSVCIADGPHRLLD